MLPGRWFSSPAALSLLALAGCLPITPKTFLFTKLSFPSFVLLRSVRVMTLVISDTQINLLLNSSRDDVRTFVLVLNFLSAEFFRV